MNKAMMGFMVMRKANRLTLLIFYDCVNGFSYRRYIKRQSYAERMNMRIDDL